VRNPCKAGFVMRTLWILSLVFCAVVSAGCQTAGSRSGGGATSEGDVAAVLGMEQAWTDAMRAHNYAQLETILAEEFRLSMVKKLDRPGKPEITREMWLGNLENMSFGPVTMLDMHVTMHGNNRAIVEMHMTLKDWTMFGNPLPADYDLTDVWVRREGRWRVVARISEELEQAAR